MRGGVVTWPSRIGNWLAGMDGPAPEAVGELVAALSDDPFHGVRTYINVNV